MASSVDRHVGRLRLPRRRRWPGRRTCKRSVAPRRSIAPRPVVGDDSRSHSQTTSINLRHYTTRQTYRNFNSRQRFWSRQRPKLPQIHHVIKSSLSLSFKRLHNKAPQITRTNKKLCCRKEASHDASCLYSFYTLEWCGYPMVKKIRTYVYSF